ncbi:Ligand-dependent corepressor [Varanus komodoensis]|nr:Ligand-dependent corepressor [Varanus komodoensis]
MHRWPLEEHQLQEHLGSLDEPALEVGHQALLRQEQARIIRFERQAEEFLHAVFYQKDSPRVSDPNIPLVAREIMQRMIRQFAAEYTSKTSSTQDSSSPNSTKNQSLLKASLVASSPVGATAQNPVLSKLLMADQDSPLDLTVRKSQLDPSEQDGVLDLSTKKSPCAGSASLSHSAGCSTTPGNGEDAADCLGQPKSPLEKFMVRLCTYHQKHFVHVLNDICTEAQTSCEGQQQLSGPENMDVSTCSSGCSQYRTENQELGTSCSESKLPSSLDPEQSGPHGSLRILCHALKQQAVDLKATDRRENCSPVVRRDFPDLSSIRTTSVSARDSPTQGYLTASNSHHSAKSLEGQTPGSEQDVGLRKGEDDKDQIQSRALLSGYIAAKASNFNASEDSLESRMVSQKNMFKTFPEEAREPAFTTSSPRRADKENALQCSSKASLHQDTEMNDQEARLKAENIHQSSGKNKVSYHMHPIDKTHVENAKDTCWPPPNPIPVSHHKTTNGHPRTKSISASTKSTRKSKRSSGLRINDYDNQCDVVYISQPITECHFESKRTMTSKKTARKSTRGYYYNGECCELPTVRTLAKMSYVQDTGNTLAPRPEVLTNPSQGVVLPGNSYSAGAQVLSDHGDKSSSTGSLPQEGSLNIKSQDGRNEQLPAERILPDDSSLEQREVSSAKVSTMALSLIPCSILLGDEGSLPLPSLQTTIVSSPQQTEGELQDKTERNTVLQSGSDVGSISPNADDSNAVDSVQLPVSRAADGEESSLCLKKVSTAESSIHADQEPPVRVDLLLPEKPAAGMNLLHPLEEPASVGDLPPPMEPLPPSPTEVAKPHAEPLVNLDSLETLPAELSPVVGSLCSEEPGAGSTTESPMILPASPAPEPPAHIDLEPLEAPLIEPPMVAPGKMESALPQRLSNLDAVELPIHSQCANAHESMDPETNIEGTQDLEEGKSGVMLSVAEIEENWGRESIRDTTESNKMSEGRETESEALPMPKTSETGNKMETSFKTNPEKKRKREKKPQVISDRCLRSQQPLSPSEDSTEQPNSSTSMQLPQLQIKLSKSPGAKRFKREVHLDGAASVCVPTDSFHKALQNDTGKTLEPQEGKENDITMRQICKTVLTKETLTEESQDAEGNKTKPTAMLEIYLEADSDKRSVHVPVGTSEKGDKPTELMLEDPGNSDSTMDAKKLSLIQRGTSCPGSKNESKHAPTEKSVKYKRAVLQCYNLRHTPAPVSTISASQNMSGVETIQGDSNVTNIQAGSNVTDQQDAEPEEPTAFNSMEILINSKPKFVEWCSEEENQELITDFNAHYMKIQKGWIQLEKEAQPAPKVKNKSDKLKEIWKSKKRTRKFKGSTEVQKLSPVQMLFMKPFEMPNICKWLMETTETKSLVIVKKLNTRLPGDIPLIKLPLQKGCSSGIYSSSLQAERLKKHLKKFPAMSPAKNTIKTQRMWARIRENTEETEPEQIASPKETPPSEVSLERGVEAKGSQPPPSMPVQTSSRILRKYSNLRGKLHGLCRVVKPEKSDAVAKHPLAESKSNSKSLCIKPLMSPKLAQQVKVTPLPTKSSLVEKGGKGKKGKGRSQEDLSSKCNLKQSRKKAPDESSSRMQGHLSKEKVSLKKACKLKLLGAPSIKKQTAVEKSNKHTSQSGKAKKSVDAQPRKRKLPTQKSKANPSLKASLSSRQEGLAKPVKPKVTRDSSSRSLKVPAKKANSSKALTRSVKSIQESKKAQSKRRLRAKKDSSPSKRRRLDAK